MSWDAAWAAIRKIECPEQSGIKAMTLRISSWWMVVALFCGKQNDDDYSSRDAGASE
jgi:hypothetical protein